MKKILLLFCLFIISNINVFSQNSFTQGYYIDTLDKKVDCLIQNKDWKDNPIFFKYKLSEDAKIKLANIVDVKEFGVGFFKYVRRTTLIDKSSDAVNQLNDDSAPEYVKETHFFRVLLEGEATLYSYENSEIKRFLYSYGESDIQQLVYKSYIIPVNKIVKNYSFRKQLSDALICESVSIRQIQKLEYEQKALIDFFKGYNECKNSEFKLFNTTKKKDLFNLNIRPGLSYSSMVFRSENSILDIESIDFGYKSTFRFGIEAEFFLPYNKNKWSILIEPNYQYFQSRIEVNLDNLTPDYFEVNTKSIEIPLGLRYYILLGENSRFFVNAAISSDIGKPTVFSFGSEINIDIRSRLGTALGVGYQFKRISIEARYQRKRITSPNLSWYLDYEKISFTAGYSLF